MFNLLRRSRRGKTHKAKVYETSDEEDRPSRYSSNATLPSALSREERPERAARRAVIEELEDFASDDDNDGDNEAGSGDEERLKLAKTAANGRSDNLSYINKTDGDARTTTDGRNAAPSSQNEAASAIAGRSNRDRALIGISEPQIDGPSSPVITHRQRTANDPQKRQSLLSLGGFRLPSSGESSAKSPETEPKKRRTLQKSRDFLSDIFMARGRNHQRQKQQQQQQIAATGKPNKSNKSNAKDVIASAAHLETNSDPALASPNTYQMTLANNSCPENGDDQQRAKRSSQERSSNPAGAIEEHRDFPAERQHFPSESEREKPRAMRSFSRSAERQLIQAASVERETQPEQQPQQQQQQLPTAGNASAPQQHLAKQQHQAPQQQQQQEQQQPQSSDITMGQTSAKPNEISSAHSSRASTPREFRESVVSTTPPQAPPRHQKSPEVPKITVEDCSFHSSEEEDHPETFYELNNQAEASLNIEELNEAHIEALEDEVFASDIPATIYQNTNSRPWTRLSHVKLENVREEEEEHDEDDDEVDEAVDLEYEPHAGHQQANGTSRQSASSERSALKSDSNLSSSYADSGIGDQELPPQNQQQQQQPPQPPPRSSSHHLNHHLNFIRDGNSTDCEETFLQCDELDDGEFSEQRLVCIESISLPDVVVESTTAGTTTSASSSAAAGTAASAAAAGGAAATTNGGDSQININIANGAGGNSLGNVHFIPIHVEGRSRSRSGSPKQRSWDDSCLGQDMPPSIEIVEDGSVLNKPVRQESPFDSQELR